MLADLRSVFVQALEQSILIQSIIEALDNRVNRTVFSERWTLGRDRQGPLLGKNLESLK